MSKARDLADFISTGSILSDGTIESTEINGVTADASELNVLDGITVTTEELNNVAGISTSVQTQLDGKQDVVTGVSDTEIGYLDGVTSNLQTQLDNISVTSGSLTKSFASGETASITLAQAISPAPVVSVTKEVPQTGISSKGAWDVATDGANYERHDTAYDTTLTLSSTFNTPFNPSGSAATSLTNSISFTSYFTSANVYAIAINNDGTKFYGAEPSGGVIRQFNLTTAYDITTLSVNGTYTSSEEGGIKGIHFKPDGTKMYIVGFNNDTVYEYDLTTAFDITTASYSNNSFAVTGQLSNAWSVRLSSDGTTMYAVGGYNQGMYQYTLSTAWNVSTASYASKSLNVQSQETDITEVVFNSDGTKLFGIGLVNDRIYNWNLSTPWDISTGSFSTYYSVQSEDNQTWGFAMSSNDTIAYVLGQQNDKFYQYSIGSSALTLGSGSFASTDVGKQIEGNGGKAILTATDGSYSVVTAFNDSSTIASGDWGMFNTTFDASAGIKLSSFTESQWDISTASFSQSFSVSAQSSVPLGLFFKPDGTQFWVIDDDDHIYAYDMSSAWDVSSSTYSQSLNMGFAETAPTGLFFKPDGTKLFVVGSTGDGVDELNLSTPWDISSAGFVGFTSVSSQDNIPNAIFIKPDGTKMYISGNQNDSVYEYNLNNTWSRSSISYVGSKSVSSQTTNPADLHFKSDGTKMYVIGRNNAVFEYNLSTPWSITTASYSQSFSVASQDTNSDGLFFKPDGSKMYTTGYGLRNVNEYNVGTFAMPLAQYSPAITNSSGQIDSSTWIDIDTMVADEAANDGEVYYAVSTDDRTTWSVIKEGSGVRPIVRDNAGTWEYNSDAGSVVGYQLSNASYDSVSLNHSSQTGSNTDLGINSDGTKIYVLGANTVFEYDLTTAYDLSTASYSGSSFNVSGQEPTALGIQFKPDGTKMYVSGFDNTSVHQYSLSTAFDISTASYDSVSFNLSSQGIRHQSLAFSSDGTKMYTGENDSDNIYQYALSTAWDLSTASYSSNSFSVSSQLTLPHGLDFNSSGTKMFVLAQDTNTVYQYTLSTAWDITSTSYDGVSFSVSAQGSDNNGVVFSGDGRTMYVASSSKIDQYTTETIGFGTNTTWTSATSNTELYALQEALGATSVNRMDKTQLGAVTDPNHYTLGDTLDLMIGLYMPSAGTSPTSDGVTINYDAEALNQGAVLGTDYDYDFPDSTTVRVTSNAAQNLKIRVV